MRITEFKEGDIITRTAPMTYAHNGCKDGSYLGDRLIFQGVDESSKIIVFVDQFGDALELSYGRDAWDEGWGYFPETLWVKAQKLGNALKELWNKK